VFINGKGAHRMGDQNRHCGGMGQLVEGSPNVIVGESGGGPGSGGAAGSRRNSVAVGAGGGSGGGARGAGSGSGSGADGGGRSGGGTSGGAGRTGPGTPGDNPPVTRTIEPDAIEVQVVDVRGQPCRDVDFALTMPDGTRKAGFTASDG